MRPQRRRLVVIALAGVLVVAAGTVLPFAGFLPLNENVTPLRQVVEAMANVLWLAVAAVLATRRSDRAWLLPIALVFANEVWTLAYTGSPPLYFFANAFLAVNTAVYAHVLLAFPDGRLHGRYDRGFVGLAYALLGVSGAAGLFLRQPGIPGFANPFGLWAADDLADTIQSTIGLAVQLVGLGLLYGVWRHWRDATPAARRALRPLLVALPLFYVITSIGQLADVRSWTAISSLVRSPLFVASGLILPIGYLIGVLRARLGRARLAQLATALGAGVPIGGLRDLLAGTLGDPSLQLAFASPGGGYVDPEGRVVDPMAPDATLPRAATPVAREGRTLALIVHDPAIDAEDPGFVEAVGSMAALALDNERLAAEVRAQLEEVRASRARITRAADEERRKVERDLHDGAQQRLVALTMRLEQARGSTPGAATLIDQTTAELREAIGDVRRLARGMHPPILTEAGLAAAVESLAERTPVPVTVRIPEHRFPPAIEAAAYYAVAEGLTNAVRYAAATTVAVEGTVDGDRLMVAVSDNGLGGADPRRGTGLRGLADRVAAAGGTLDVVSPPGGGTRLQATFPI